MKNIKLTIAILASLFAVCSLYAQSDGIVVEDIPEMDMQEYQPVIDPAGASKSYKPLSDFDYKPKEYLQYNFEERKIHYVGKPLSELLKELEIPVMSLFDHWATDPGCGCNFTSLYFENERANRYRSIVQDENPLYLSILWEEEIPCDVSNKRFELYGNNWNIINAAFYGEKVVRDVQVFGKNPSDMPPLPELEESGTTPCCAPEKIKASSGSFGLPSLEAVARKAVSDELTRSLHSIDLAKAWSCDDSFPPDSTRLNTLFDVAKNGTQSFWVAVSEILYTNGDYSSGSKTPLKKGMPQLSNPKNGCNTLKSKTIQTIPSTAYDYRFIAPTGFDLYQCIRNRKTGTQSGISQFVDAFFIAYDGSVCDFHIKNTLYTSSPNSTTAMPKATEEFRYFDQYFPQGAYYGTPWMTVFDSKYNFDNSTVIKWGFVNGSRILDEFLDVFRRLYDEGSHFSKGDAYNAALAYIIEGRGIELYHRAPDGTEWKRYNTTPVTDAAGNITGFRSTVWE